MKKLAILIVVLSLTVVACDAFKDSYDRVNEPAVQTGSGSANAGGGAVGDTTVCQALKEITVTAAEQSGTVTTTVLSTASDASKVTAVAEKVTDTSTKITIMDGDKAAVSFVILKSGDKDFSVCSVVASEMTLKSGTLTIDSFNLANKDDATKIVNAGSFKFEFTQDLSKQPAATKVMAAMAADAAPAASTDVTMEGTYFTDALTEAAVKKDEATK